MLTSNEKKRLKNAVEDFQIVLANLYKIYKTLDEEYRAKDFKHEFEWKKESNPDAKT
jgi:hypothetical protein